MSALGIPAEFFIFALALAAIAILHERALAVALLGLTATLTYKLFSLGAGAGAAFLAGRFGQEWSTLANLALLLLGFAVLANHFELSAIPETVPRILPGNWTAGLVLLVLVYGLSIFLDNIAAAVIGGVIAKHVYRGRVGIGYLFGIVAAANGGGAGSILGDTTTTLMWINGVSASAVLKAFIASAAGFAIFGTVAALQQHHFAAIAKDGAGTEESTAVDWPRALIVLILLVTLLAVNLAGSSVAPGALEKAPLLGAGLWLAILATAPWRRPHWHQVARAVKGTVFLLLLVATASLMPIEHLPPASWQSALGLGFLSAVFDNIPLTVMALRQGGYDWGILAYAVGFGGSMLWFGSSAGVALSNHYPELRSVAAGIRFGWHVPVAYLAGFFLLLWSLGWQPD